MTEEYWRGTLGAAEQQAYDAVKAALQQGQTDVPLPRGVRDFMGCFEAVIFDHPEFYWVGSGCGVSQGFGGARLQFQRIYSSFETNKFDVKIDVAKDTVKSRAQGISDERELCRIAAEYLLDSVTYQIDVRMNQNAAAALCLYKAQCTGIALAAKTLLDALGVWCIAVNGEISSGGRGGPHCWNIVRIGANYYHLDVTSMLGANGGAGGGPARKPYTFLYLSYSDVKIGATHRWGKQTPPCTDTRYDEADGFSSAPAPAQSAWQPPRQAQPSYSSQQAQPAAPPQTQPKFRWPFSRMGGAGKQPQSAPQPSYPPQQAQPAPRAQQTPPAGMKKVSSQYEIKQLFPAQPSGKFKTTFYYETEASPEKQAKLVEEAIRSYYTARNVGGSFNYSYTGNVWTVELQFEV